MPSTSEIGTSGLAHSAGRIDEEYLTLLRGEKAMETWRSMKDNDPIVGAILFAIDMVLRQVEWHVEKKDAKQSDADFLEECMEDMSQPWGDVISEVLSMLPYGFAVHEIVYKERRGPQPFNSKYPSSKFTDGKVGWRKLPLRAQDTIDHWDFDEQGGIRGIVQKDRNTYKDIQIPMEKLLLFRLNVYKNNPEGRSILRNAFKAWYYKNRIEQHEGTGIERDLAGFPVVWLPAQYLAPDADETQKAVVTAFKTMAENIRRDKQEYLIMPLEYDDSGNKMYDFTLMSSSGSRQFDTNQIIGRYEQRIAMTVLADFILLGHEKVGSFALSSDKTDLFAVALGTVLDSIQDVFNRYAVPRLFQLNGLDVKNLPEIVHGDIEKPDLTELAGYIQNLSSTGMPLFPDDDLEKYLREAANLPERSEEAKQLQEQQKQEQQDGTVGGGAQAAGGGTGGGSDTYGGFDLSGL